MKRRGLLVEHVVRAVLDEQTCDRCRRLDGLRVLGNPEHVTRTHADGCQNPDGCRCALVPVTGGMVIELVRRPDVAGGT